MSRNMLYGYVTMDLLQLLAYYSFQLLKKLPVVAKGKIEINIDIKYQFFLLLIFSLKSFFLKLKNNSFEIKRNRIDNIKKVIKPVADKICK